MTMTGDWKAITNDHVWVRANGQGVYINCEDRVVTDTPQKYAVAVPEGGRKCHIDLRTLGRESVLAPHEAVIGRVVEHEPKQ